MYSLVIADDEEVIRNGLRQVVNWEELGFQVVSVVPDGERVVDLLREREVSVVLADIRMPRLSGIELADVIHQKWPDTRVVILTGYEKFEYAQRAIDCDVFSYLLKPCKEDAIIDVFGRLKAELDAAAGARSMPPVADGTEILAAICHRADPPQDLSAVPPVFRDSLCAVLLSDFVPDPSAAPEERRLRRAAAHEFELTAGDRDDGESGGIVFRSASGMVARVLCGESEQALETEARAIVERLRRAGTAEGDWSASLGQPVARAELLRSSYLDAEQVIGHRLYLGKGRLITRRDISRPAAAVDPERIRELGTDAGRFLWEGDAERTSACVAELFSRLEEARLNDPLEATLHVEHFVYSMRLALSDFALDMDTLVPEWPRVQRQLHGLLCLSDYRQVLLPTFAAAADAHAAAMRHPSNHLARQCVRIVRERFRENLGLELLASELDVSPTHLSRTFKQETGINFKDFLCSTRLAEARRCLETTTLKVYEIAGTVGFGDEHYFSDVFKKKVGVTPAEFRRIAARVPTDAIRNKS
ncbi:response regulator transcription factor [Salinispira pacifica]